MVKTSEPLYGQNAEDQVTAMVTKISINPLEHEVASGAKRTVVPGEATVEFDCDVEFYIRTAVAQSLFVGQVISMPRVAKPDYEQWIRNFGDE